MGTVRTNTKRNGMTGALGAERLALPRGLSWEDLTIELLPRPTVRILVVHEGRLDTSFGIWEFVQIVRANVDGYVRLVLDVAELGTRDGGPVSIEPSPGSEESRYSNFRFSSRGADGQFILHGYDEVWCFGWDPDIEDGARNGDATIAKSPYASTDEDLCVLVSWMNGGGGVLAMGDHDILGAAMCSRIPRVRSMRRWTRAQGAPPEFGSKRHTTIRGPGGTEADGTPQEIEWKKYPVPSVIFAEQRYRPHPLLCGGAHGIIDVLPDHMHEGWLFEDAEVDLLAEYGFSANGQSVSGMEYPQPSPQTPYRPEVVAWGHILPHPPQNIEAKRFGMIGVYDGHPAQVGRVVVDSTWHHWFDFNLHGFDREGDDYQKFSRYYRNCAIWLAREEQLAQMLTYASLISVFLSSTQETYSAGAPLIPLGKQALDVIGRLTSECLAREMVNPFLPTRLVDGVRAAWSPWNDDDPEPNWSSPPLEVLHRSVMGGIIRALIPVRESVHLRTRDPQAPLEFSPASVSEAVRRGATQGIEHFQRILHANRNTLEEIDRACSEATGRGSDHGVEVPPG